MNRFLKRPLSHSQLSAWEYSPKEWYSRYILGQFSPPTPEMRFGNVIGDAIGTENNPVPDLMPPGVKEYAVKGEVEGISLRGYIDHWCPDTLELHENKTSAKPTRWTKRKADNHKQIDMYLLLLNQQDGVEPEDVTCYLNFIQTRPSGLGYRLHKEPKWQQFELRTRTLADLESYKTYVVTTVEAMQEYIDSRPLSTDAPRPPVFKGV